MDDLYYVNAYYQFKLLAPLVGISAALIVGGIASLWMRFKNPVRYR